ncbi:MAG: hypothetical protein JXR30_02285 [Alphaproteobacteria bacterium]|nr:hypothetical protein [Alphaproteobacteria bacterium]
MNPFFTACYMALFFGSGSVFAQTSLSDDLENRYENGASHSGISCPNGVCEAYADTPQDQKPAWPVSNSSSQEEIYYIQEEQTTEETYQESQPVQQQEPPVVYEEQNQPYQQEVVQEEQISEEPQKTAPKSSTRQYYMRMDLGFAFKESDAEFKGAECGDGAWLGCDLWTQEKETFIKGSYDGAISKTMGLGLNINSFLRLDLTFAERSDFKFKEDTSARGTTQHFDVGYSDPTDELMDIDMNVSDTVQNTTFMLSLYVDFFRRYSHDEYGRKNQSAVAPYIGLGVGYAKNVMSDMIGEYTTHYRDVGGAGANAQDIDGIWRLEGAENSGFAWTATAGIAFALSERFWLDVGYRYLSLGTVQSGSYYSVTMDTDLNDDGISGNTGDLDFTGASGGGPDGNPDPGYVAWDNAGKQEFDLKVHEISIGLRYEF